MSGVSWMDVSPEVLALLGKTMEELADMPLGEFAALSYRKGVIWSFSADGGRVQGLTITLDKDDGHAVESA